MPCPSRPVHVRASRRWLIAAAVALGLPCTTWAQSTAPRPANGTIYTCIDAQGRLLSSDRPIAECRDRVQRELTPTGTVRRVIPPPPTPEEREREREAARQRSEAEAAARAAEERRREQLLLTRYPDEAAHQRARATALQQVQAVIDSARQHTAQLEREKQRLDEELEFYRRDPHSAPPALKQRLAQNAEQRQLQAQFLADQEREKTRIEERYDAELRTLRRLWAAPAADGSARGAAPAVTR
ncbi:DUF4124 domain-containing protein [Tepidimonas sp.]|uniref:DUF4124 domain-containing protein n=1 Tax=Tepidimonas sp. TaxID=2002775 RepID=UPI00391A1EFD